MARPKGKRQDRQQPPLAGDDGEPLRDPDGLRPRERLFVEYYCGVANFNASKAYALAGYKPHRENASQLLTKDHIKAAIATRTAARVEAAVMSGDEALQRLSLYARADIGPILGADDPITKLPDSVRLTVKSVRPGRYGRTVELHDSMKATELLARAAGALKETVKIEHTLEEIMAQANALAAERAAGKAS